MRDCFWSDFQRYILYHITVKYSSHIMVCKRPVTIILIRAASHVHASDHENIGQGMSLFLKVSYLKWL